MNNDKLRRQIADLKAWAATTSKEPIAIGDLPEQAIALGETLLMERTRIAAALALLAEWPQAEHGAEVERRIALRRALTGVDDGR